MRGKRKKKKEEEEKGKKKKKKANKTSGINLARGASLPNPGLLSAAAAFLISGRDEMEELRRLGVVKILGELHEISVYFGD